MSSTSDLRTSVETFAELSAMMADPFADRAVLLSGVGLDEVAWTRLNDDWLAAFREPAGDALARRFAVTFEQTKKRPAGEIAASETSEPHRAGEPRFLTAQAQPWRAEAARVGEAATGTPPPLATALAVAPATSLSATQDTGRPAAPPAPPSCLSATQDTGRPAAALPLPSFLAAPAVPPPATPSPPAVPGAPKHVVHPLAGTADVDASALRGDALPFAPAPPEDLTGTLPLGATPAVLWPFTSSAPPKPKP